jgi:hypothetical protein
VAGPSFSFLSRINKICQCDKDDESFPDAIIPLRAPVKQSEVQVLYHCTWRMDYNHPAEVSVRPPFCIFRGEYDIFYALATFRFLIYLYIYIYIYINI